MTGTEVSKKGKIIRGRWGVIQVCGRIAVLLSLAIIIGLIGCSPSDSEITVYPVAIQEGRLIPLNRTTYKISISRQDVIYWYPNVKLPPRRLKNCVVADRKNWTGEYSDGSGKVSMVHGKFCEEPSYPDTFYVKGWRYWFITIKSWFGLYDKMARENKRSCGEELMDKGEMV